MGLYYKMDVLSALKEAGYSTNRLRADNILSESVIHNLRKKSGIGFETIDKLCGILKCQPGDIIGFNNDDSRMRQFEKQTLADIGKIVSYGRGLDIPNEYILETISVFSKYLTRS